MVGVTLNFLHYSISEQRQCECIRLSVHCIVWSNMITHCQMAEWHRKAHMSLCLLWHSTMIQVKINNKFSVFGNCIHSFQMKLQKSSRIPPHSIRIDSPKRTKPSGIRMRIYRLVRVHATAPEFDLACCRRNLVWPWCSSNFILKFVPKQQSQSKSTIVRC